MSSEVPPAQQLITATEEEEEEEEDLGQQNEEAEAHTASLTSQKVVEVNEKEKIIDETASMPPNNADSDQKLEPDKEGESDNQKQIEDDSTTAEDVTDGQPRMPIIKVEKEPRNEDDDVNGTRSMADNSKPREDASSTKPDEVATSTMEIASSTIPDEVATSTMGIEKKPKIGSLTVLGPSLLNSSVMKNGGAVSITPANALTETTNGGFVNGGTCEVCEVTTDDLEAHRISLRHYKCSESACAVLTDSRSVLFDSRDQLNQHRAKAHQLPPLHHLGGSIQPQPFASLPAATNTASPTPEPDSTNGVTVTIKRLQPQTLSGVSNAKERKLDVLLPDSGTQGGAGLSGAVQLRPGSSVSITAAPPKPKQPVANILATRGITVTPAGSNRSQQQQQQSPLPAPLTLSSAISILPATNKKRQERGFAVPQGRVRLPTVDLTRDEPPQPRARPRPLRFTCQVCDKAFVTRDALSSHMASHSSHGKLPYRCNLCSAQYPTQQGLSQHKQTYHKQRQQELVVPVVDVSVRGVSQRLAACGVRHLVPLSQLQSQSGGLFAVPLLSPHSRANFPAATNILPLGPITTIANHR
ncbi:hypothetical protein LSTR_LSTR007680 [Laodelphax striatellus]|uniref:C2H2-type domain-containing protein n=1 Tax=Laodelphax striatellus TaxID=195883 RepID=A0A482WIJ1_LAOST|nr:hypothetical protein LSTR_LSTR007680 [Laodelphax striatellus]